MRCAIKAKSEKPSKMAAGSKTINSKITSRYIAQSSVDGSHLVPCFKAWRQRFCAGGQPKEAGLRVQDWDMWLKIFCVGRCWISLRELATSGLALLLLLQKVTTGLGEPHWTSRSRCSNSTICWYGILAPPSTSQNNKNREADSNLKCNSLQFSG